VDPTYVRSEINAKPEWREAFRLSELYNENAPIGWSRCVGLTEAEAKNLYLPPVHTKESK
jgi:hypothetical protein